METDNLEETKSGGRFPQQHQHPCKFCSASFTSELELILHFREEHYLTQGEEGEEDDPFLSSESDSDEAGAITSSKPKPGGGILNGGGDDDESEDGEPGEEGTAAGGVLDFLTDRERALLAEPVFDPFPEPEGEEDDQENLELEVADSEPEADISEDLVMVGPEHEDFSFWRGLQSSETGGEASHVKSQVPDQPPAPSSPSPLPKRKAESAEDKPPVPPSKRIMPGRKYRMIYSASTPGGGRSRRQLTLRLLPLLRTPEKGTPPPLKGKVNKDEDKVKSKVIITAPPKTKAPAPVKNRREGSPGNISRCPKKVVAVPRGKMSKNKNEVKEHQPEAKASRPRTRKTPATGNVPRFECIFCGQTFSREWPFHAHLRLHNMERPYFCKLCDKSFGRVDYLTNHVRNQHTNVGTLYTCKLCKDAFSFSTHEKLRYHHSVVHAKPNSGFKCEYCDKMFSTRPNRARHRKVHFNEMKYKCPHCPKEFKRSDTLQNHMRSLHNLGTTLRCRLCRKEFPTKYSLGVHKRLMHSSESSKNTTKGNSGRK